jgi:tetratricopeptide (TPR) repeat protein
MKLPLLVLFGACWIGASLFAGPRDAQWLAVDDAIRRGLPQTAIAALEPIVAAAVADGAHAEAVKAIGRKIALEGQIQGNRAEEKITRLQAELARAPVEIKPLLEAMLAHWYWEYFQQNRWRFLQRTPTAAASGDDIKTWDLARILAEIDRRFAAALADEERLKGTSIHAFGELLPNGSVPDSYRPALFDFIAYEALGFYQAGEQGAVRSEDEFELDANSTPIFAEPEAFLSWQPPLQTEAAAAPLYRAIRLLQKLMVFHRDDADRSAFLDADLARLRLGYNKAFGDDSAQRYKAALERFAAANSDHELSARALSQLAGVWEKEGEPARAHAIARRALQAFPEHAASSASFNLVQRIAAPHATIETERVWNAPWPTIDVTYRNVTKVYFRAVRFAFEDQLARTRWDPVRLTEEERDRLVGAKPTHAWSADLPATLDFKSRTERLAAPASLAPGFYFILASHDASFAGLASPVSVASVWVSTLALVTDSRGDDGARGGFVLDARSGEPIEAAIVRTWYRNRDGRFEPSDVTHTDADGRFDLSTGANAVLVLAESRGQAVASADVISLVPHHDADDAIRQTILFTDRGLYRPGQTIHYKGIVMRADRARGKYAIMASEPVTVVFNDANGKEVARAEHRTNDYGSFSGVFTAPRDRLLGQMSVQAWGVPGATWFAVEDYKRPKFRVEIAAQSQAPKLDQGVDVVGRAVTYTGAAIAGAKFKWRVERSVRMPGWCWWWQPPATKAIAHGTGLTSADGAFALQFPAVPDRSVPAVNEPVFSFKVHVEITDSTGETRTEERVIRAGYAALQANIQAAEWQTPRRAVEFKLETMTLDRTPQPANGRLRVHALKQPAAVPRAELSSGLPFALPAGRPGVADPSNPDMWELGEVVAERAFTTGAEGTGSMAIALPAGIYRALLETQDRDGGKVTARQTVRVIDPDERQFRIREPHVLLAPKWSLEPGERFVAYWGTGYDAGRALVELECNGNVLKRYWTDARRTQQPIELEVTEEMRGGFSVRVRFVRENRCYWTERIVEVPWSNKQLALKWERFRSKLEPGARETWTAVLTGPDAKRAAGEMVAGLYATSLDLYRRHQWPQRFSVFRREHIRLVGALQNRRLGFRSIHGLWPVQESRRENWSYRTFPHDLVAAPISRYTDAWSEGVIVLQAFSVQGDAVANTYGAAMSVAGSLSEGQVTSPAPTAAATREEAPAERARTVHGLTQVTARRNLQETAFFLPHVRAGRDGEVRLEFTLPEALTEWRFLGFAHDKQLRSGFLEDRVVTAKELMVEPNPPRFLREGDTVEFAVKVTNASDQMQAGTLRLSFADTSSLASVDGALGNREPAQSFSVPAKSSRSYTWRISVPDGLGFVTYKAVGSTGRFSDGEEGVVPVLSRRILVTESLPLSVRGRTTRDFEFAKLLGARNSSSLRHQGVTVQMVSQPAWSAVLALPYLLEFPYDCSEQVFNKLYATALARHIANSDPKIRRIFDLWKNTPALDSPLEKNSDLKSVLLEETPWLRHAQRESEARRNVGALFDANRLEAEAARSLQALADRQLSDGLWPWFPGGQPNEYISLYIAAGFGRLRHLGVPIDTSVGRKALRALDMWMARNRGRILSPDDYVPTATDALYLYARTLFLAEHPIAATHQPVVEFYCRQARTFWRHVHDRQSQAHLALALRRLGDEITPHEILASLKERSVSDAELGRYWRDTELSSAWYRAPIETQALMIEAFAEVTRDAQAVEDCKVWLLKQKQVQAWQTTKATADAVYALLLRGENLLASDARVEVSLAGRPLKPERLEPGTGFYEKRFSAAEVTPELGRITVKKSDDGVSWGSVHWQYLEDVGKITAHAGTPLTLNKTLWVKESSSSGQRLHPVSRPIAVGDELVVRLELRTDRDLEYLHLKDQRGSGTEPVNVLSRYRWQDSLGYYESTRDAASHFFIDYLPKGTYVFEYSTRVQLRGRYESGIAEIQCMYAPEFTSHSGSVAIEVR